jgi:hypothetical protein
MTIAKETNCIQRHKTASEVAEMFVHAIEHLILYVEFKTIPPAQTEQVGRMIFDVLITIR